MQLPATATARGEIGLNLDAREATPPAAPFDINDARTYNKATSLTIYDSLGNSHSLSTYYVKTADNTWAVHAALDGAALPASIGALNFDADGTLNTTTTTLPFTLSLNIAGGAVTPQPVDLDFANATQFGSAFSVDTLTQDGFSAGQLAGYGIGDDGIVIGRYSNGQTRNLGQIVLANFKNPQGLNPLGNNAFAETSESGQPIPGVPGASNFGIVKSGVVEESNVDLTRELVDMITAQRVYQANAQTIKTQDQVMNTIVNLR
jgi:flagellar hook protein FlgE